MGTSNERANTWAGAACKALAFGQGLKTSFFFVGGAAVGKTHPGPIRSLSQVRLARFCRASWGRQHGIARARGSWMTQRRRHTVLLPLASPSSPSPATTARKTARCGVAVQSSTGHAPSRDRRSDQDEPCRRCVAHRARRRRERPTTLVTMRWPSPRSTTRTARRYTARCRRGTRRP